MKTNQRTLISHHKTHGKIDILFQRAKLLYNHSLFYLKQRYIFKDITLQFIHSNKDKSWKDDIIPNLERRDYYKDLGVTVQYRKTKVKDKDNKEKTIKVKTLLQDGVEITEKDFLKQLKTLFESNHKDFRFLSYQSLYKEIYSLLQSKKLYSRLPPKVAQNILKQAIQDMNSFKSLLTCYYSGKISYKPKLPRYKKKFMGLTFDKDCIRVKTQSNGKKYIQLSTKSQLGTYIQIPFPQIIQDKTLPHQIRLNPSGVGFQIDYVYIDDNIGKIGNEGGEQSKDSILNKNQGNILSLDLGVRNFATGFNCNTCESIIINGKGILGWSKFYKYIDSYLKSQLVLQSNKSGSKQRTSKRLQQRQVYYKNRMRDFTHKASKLIIDYCLENDVNKVIIGYNPGWKKDLKKRRQLGKQNRSEFVLLPYTSFIEKLKYKGENYGIKVVLQEESYTSKVDHLVDETMEHHETYLGKRNGKLFKSSCGITLNAEWNFEGTKGGSKTTYEVDINGAIGIMKKYFERDDKNKTNLSSKEKISYEVFKRNLKGLVVKGGVSSPIRTNVI